MTLGCRYFSASATAKTATLTCASPLPFSARLPVFVRPPPLPLHPLEPTANYIDRDGHRTTRIPSVQNPFFRRQMRSSADVSMSSWSGSQVPHPPRHPSAAAPVAPTLVGDRVMTFSCRWSAKFYGQVTFGPRGFAYPSSRWLARRFRMKKHKILKRFRFRRYKLAAVANLPFAKMIRVGMLPELKSSKTRKGDAVEAGLSSQLVTQARTSTGGKVKGRRSRPKSKYQV